MNQLNRFQFCFYEGLRTLPDKNLSLSCIETRILRLTREVTRPTNNIRQVGEECENTVVQNISVTHNPLAAANGETEL